MEELSLQIDAAWAAGLVLSITRVAGFVVASPLLARMLPMSARAGVAVSIGLFLASPPQVELTTGFLLSATLVNAAIGIALGYLSGMIMQLFPVAGGVIDMTSGLAAAAVIDPTRGEQGAIFSRIFSILGLALFYVLGGLAILVRGLELSVRVIPLDGGLAPSTSLLGIAASLTGKLFLAGVELALPVIAALFVTELVLGVASKFAPQANIFMVGLPAKIFVALVMTSVSLVLFPETMDGVLRIVTDTMRDVLLAISR